MHPAIVIVGLWLAWGLSWIAAALWSDRAEARVGLGAELGYRLVLIAGAVLLAVPAHGYHGPMRLWSPGWTGAWTCTALIAAGFAFCWWARIHLGRLWSGSITRKAGHHVVDSGPYGLVRHPIYTGVLLATWATAAVKGTVYGLSGAALITLGFYLKARMEENWLRQELGAEAYDGYRRRVPMLVPFLPGRG
jgi:protein-S-isoprenylcysteine O-methyltransferase Ste14